MENIRMLKDLEIEELKKILFKNDRMLEQISQRISEDLLEQQAEEANLLFGNNHHLWIDIKSHYTSFFLRLKDWEKFIDNLDVEHLNGPGIEKYNEILKDIEEWYQSNFTIGIESNEDLEEKIEQKCEELLLICEKILHEYEETPTSEDILDYFVNNEIEFNDYYVDNNDVICLDIAYTKKFN